jgi:hypothetical protein
MNEKFNIFFKNSSNVFLAWVTNFACNYFGTFSFLTFITNVNFIIFLIQSFRHSINLHILIYATYLSKINVLTQSLKNITTKKKSLLKLWYQNFYAFNLISIFVINIK